MIAHLFIYIDLLDFSVVLASSLYIFGCLVYFVKRNFKIERKNNVWGWKKLGLRCDFFQPRYDDPHFLSPKKFGVEKWGSMYLGLWFPSTLLQRGVIKEDIDERDQLLAPSNIGDYFISNFFLYMSKSLVKKSNMTAFFWSTLLWALCCQVVKNSQWTCHKK